MFGLSIRSKLTDGETPLYTRMKIDGKSVWVNLHLPVDIKMWNKVSVSLTKQTNYLDRIRYREKLSKIELGVQDLRRHHRLTVESLNTLIQDVVLSEIREQLRKDEERKKYIEERKNKSVKTFVKRYIEGIKKGENRNLKGERYSPNSIKTWNQFLRIFMEFSKNKSFTWDEMNKSHIDSFLNHLDKIGYKSETKQRYIGIFKTLINVSEQQGLHHNRIIGRFLNSHFVRDDERRTLIYLTKDELRSLYEMELSGMKEKVRDVFLVGCYTGQRFSDYSKIDEEYIRETGKGTKVIHFTQEKTKKKVSIPILNEDLETLLRKYDYNVPRVNEQVLNRYIKNILRDLSETVPSLSESKRTLLTLTEIRDEEEGRMKFVRDEEGYVIKHRWEMVSSHTCRRFFTTNMYLSGKFSIQQIMSLTGHTKEKTFKKYLRLTEDEYADDVARVGKDGLF